MSVYSPEYHAMVSSPGSARTESVTVTAIRAANGTTNQSANQDESFFHHLLNVVNPLQHIPVIGTIYRAITGEHIDSFEKIAGDTLYGGMWGAISSIADVAFQGITGKSFEDTALALFKSDDKARVASTKVTASPITTSASLPTADLPSLSSTAAANVPDGPDVAALTGALSAKGVDSDTASRALYAYRRSMAFTAQPVFASVP